MNIDKFIEKKSTEDMEDVYSPHLAAEIAKVFDDIDGVLIDCGVFDHKRKIRISFEKDGSQIHLCLTSKKTLDIGNVPEYLAQMKSNYLKGNLDAVI